MDFSDNCGMKLLHAFDTLMTGSHRFFHSIPLQKKGKEEKEKIHTQKRKRYQDCECSWEKNICGISLISLQKDLLITNSQFVGGAPSRKQELSCFLHLGCSFSFLSPVKPMICFPIIYSVPSILANRKTTTGYWLHFVLFFRTFLKPS